VVQAPRRDRPISRIVKGLFGSRKSFGRAVIVPTTVTFRPFHHDNHGA
jgi:hypothetical protein